YLIGDAGKIKQVAGESGTSLEGVHLVDTREPDRARELAGLYYEIRRSRGIQQEEAEKESRHVMNFGALMVRARQCDGMVGGACHTTADTLRSAIRIIGPKQGIGIVSSFFLMALPKPDFGDEGTLIYADCGVVPYPDSQQLADIAISSAESAKQF